MSRTTQLLPDEVWHEIESVGRRSTTATPSATDRAGERRGTGALPALSLTTERQRLRT
jgi:hypothetical protein